MNFLLGVFAYFDLNIAFEVRLNRALDEDMLLNQNGGIYVSSRSLQRKHVTCRTSC